MPNSYDATLNALIDDHISDWAAFLAKRCGVPLGPATPLDTDLAANLQPDRLFRINGSFPSVLHLELESTGRLGIPRELLRYNAFTHHLTELPVFSVLVLLRPKATASDLTGQYVFAGTNGEELIRFRYTVIRVWQESVADLLEAGPGIAPLALLTNEASTDLPTAFARFQDQLRATEMPSHVEQSLLGSTYVLCGLRYNPGQVESLYRNLSMTLEDSTTYQLILNRGEARGEVRGETREAQAMVLRLGTKRFGPPSEAVLTAIRGITDRERLETIAEQILDAASWDDLAMTP